MLNDILKNPYLRLIRFDKPIGTLLLLWPTLWGLWVAYGGIPPLKVLMTFVVGVFLTRAAGCAINDAADSEFDSHVKRTISRPVASGELTRLQAIVATGVLSLMAFILAAICLQGKTLLWSIPALLIFITYPFFKRFFPIPQLYLSFAFSFGIPMAFIESGMGLTLATLMIFVANCFWVLAYDTIYALVDLDDDLQIGIKTSAITFGKYVILAIMLCYFGFYVLLLLLAMKFDYGFCYLFSTLLVLIMIAYVYREIKGFDRQRCFKAFLFNNYIGMVVFIGIFLEYLSFK
ncbi:4-hydroxybenzoate octaprenyltransferase [Aquella oligotrophica]|uniref:4-hydroxybenzoate octaprenyltransferase n=1 Tax=Aquella oligotrophica TaxID=2067065 RepID=A0A2I7N521_9NEIS|nr:4-hydroxybenzoate octaprenyltransferase [Aquella oligotrophica]AUR51305.1 4-hydroxybenzoate octaprenyltransferase [Aquella oligotrophica]